MKPTTTRHVWIVYGTDGQCETSWPEGVFLTAKEAMKAVDAKHGKKEWTKENATKWSSGGWYVVERFKIGEYYG